MHTNKFITDTRDRSIETVSDPNQIRYTFPSHAYIHSLIHQMPSIQTNSVYVNDEEKNLGSSRKSCNRQCNVMPGLQCFFWLVTDRMVI
jgi:hypothetical protein